MDLDFAILADGVGPRQDGKLDLFGAGFDTIFAAAMPASHPQMLLVLRILLSVHEAEHAHTLDVILQSPDGMELARAHGEGDPLPPEIRAQVRPGRLVPVPMVLPFQRVIFHEYGAHQFVIQWDGNEVRDPLRLYLVEPPSQA